MEESRSRWKRIVGKPQLSEAKILIVCDNWLLSNKTFRKRLYQMVFNSTRQRCRLPAKDLTKWNDQGVVIWCMNQKKLMETIAVVTCFKQKKQPCVVLLWGPRAWRMEKILAGYKNILVLKAHRPSKFYKPQFTDCNHFHLAEQWIGKSIDWSL